MRKWVYDRPWRVLLCAHPKCSAHILIGWYLSRIHCVVMEAYIEMGLSCPTPLVRGENPVLSFLLSFSELLLFAGRSCYGIYARMISFKLF